jgi:hypothetical protein
VHYFKSTNTLNGKFIPGGITLKLGTPVKRLTAKFSSVKIKKSDPDHAPLSLQQGPMIL